MQPFVRRTTRCCSAQHPRKAWRRRIADAYLATSPATEQPTHNGTSSQPASAVVGDALIMAQRKRRDLQERYMADLATDAHAVLIGH
eukprot:7184423-Pyramimonas_sp.AAC.1